MFRSLLFASLILISVQAWGAPTQSFSGCVTLRQKSGKSLPRNFQQNIANTLKRFNATIRPAFKKKHKALNNILIACAKDSAKNEELLNEIGKLSGIKQASINS